MEPTSLATTAAALVATGRGILAADESTPTITRRLSAVGMESTESLRREYRELPFTTPEPGEHVSEPPGTGATRPRCRPSPRRVTTGRRHLRDGDAVIVGGGTGG